jgi:hypothetical protein
METQGYDFNRDPILDNIESMHRTDLSPNFQNTNANTHPAARKNTKSNTANGLDTSRHK